MSTEDGGAPARKHRSRKWWPVVGVAIGTIAGAGAFSFETPIYKASTSLIIIPQRVPEDFVRSTVTASLNERLNGISQQILSRTRLERIIEEFNLYERERQQLVMGDVIEGMRTDISLSVDVPRDGRATSSFRVSFQSPDPRTAMRVTERLASLFVQENLEDRSLMADQTNQFLLGQAGEMRRRLVESQTRLEEWDRRRAGPRPQFLVAENEVLQDIYRSLIRKQEDAQIAVSLERRQIGEQFRVLDGARIPEKPIGPARLPFLVRGAVGGLATSLLLMLMSSLWRRRKIASPT